MVQVLIQYISNLLSLLTISAKLVIKYGYVSNVFIISFQIASSHDNMVSLSRCWVRNASHSSLKYSSKHVYLVLGPFEVY